MTATAGAEIVGKRNKPKIKKREPTLPPELRRAVDNDRITMERALRLVEAGGEFTEDKIADPDKPAQNVTPLRVNEVVTTWLYRREHITPSQWEAATKLRDHFERSGLEQLRAVDWTRPYVDGGQAKPEPIFRDKHLTEVNRALRELGPTTSPVVMDIVIRDVPVRDCRASSHFQNARDRHTEIITKLRDGLSRLVLLWGLPVDWK